MLERPSRRGQPQGKPGAGGAKPVNLRGDPGARANFLAEKNTAAPLQRVLRAFLEDPAAPRYGYDLMKAAGLPSGTLYPMLARLEDQKLVTSAWETPQAGGERPRRYYQLTSILGTENRLRSWVGSSVLVVACRVAGWCQRGGKRKRRGRPCHQGMGISRSAKPASIRTGWWLRRFSAQVTPVSVMCRVPVASRKCPRWCRGWRFRSAAACVRTGGTGCRRRR